MLGVPEEGINTLAKYWKITSQEEQKNLLAVIRENSPKPDFRRVNLEKKEFQILPEEYIRGVSPNSTVFTYSLSQHSAGILSLMDQNRVVVKDTGFNVTYNSFRNNLTIIQIAIRRNNTKNRLFKYQSEYYILGIEIERLLPVIIYSDINLDESRRNTDYIHFENLTRIQKTNLSFSYFKFEQDSKFTHSSIEINFNIFDQMPIKIQHTELFTPSALLNYPTREAYMENVMLIGIYSLDVLGLDVLRFRGVVNRSLHDIFYVFGEHVQQLVSVWDDGIIFDDELDTRYFAFINASFQICDLGIRLILVQDTMISTEEHFIFRCKDIIQNQSFDFNDVLRNGFMYRYKNKNNDMEIVPNLDNHYMCDFKTIHGTKSTTHITDDKIGFIVTPLDITKDMVRRVITLIDDISIIPEYLQTEVCDYCKKEITAVVNPNNTTCLMCPICCRSDHMKIIKCIYLNIILSGHLKPKRVCITEQYLMEYIYRIVNDVIKSNFNYVNIIDDEREKVDGIENVLTGTPEWAMLANEVFFRNYRLLFQFVTLTIVGSLDGETYYDIVDIFFSPKESQLSIQ
jgi:hypothetical protein